MAASAPFPGLSLPRVGVAASSSAVSGLWDAAARPQMRFAQ